MPGTRFGKSPEGATIFTGADMPQQEITEQAVAIGEAEITLEGGGYFIVVQDGLKISQHTQQHKATAKALSVKRKKLTSKVWIERQAKWHIDIPYESETSFPRPLTYVPATINGATRPSSISLRGKDIQQGDLFAILTDGYNPEPGGTFNSENKYGEFEYQVKRGDAIIYTGVSNYAY